MYDAEINGLAHRVHLGAATLLRVSAEGLGTALVLVVQSRTGHAATAGFVQMGVMLPYVLAGPVTGNAIDRTRRPRALALMLVGCYAVATMTLLTAVGRVPLGLALLIAIVVGCTEPVVVALTALVPRYVPADQLTRAYGLEAATYNVAAIAGPGLAAMLAAWAGAGYAAVAIVGSALLGLALLPLLAVPGPGSTEPGERQPVFDVITGGLVVLAANRVLRAMTTATTLAYFGMGGLVIAAVLLAEHLGASASAGGQLIAAYAAGALIGSLGSARWLSARRAEWVMLAGMVAFGLSLIAIGLSPALPWAMALFVVAGICDGPVFAATLTVRQREAPPERLGQINTTAGSLKIGAAALGAAATGALADHVGVLGLLIGMALLQFAGAAVGAFLLSPRGD